VKAADRVGCAAARGRSRSSYSLRSACACSARASLPEPLRVGCFSSALRWPSASRCSPTRQRLPGRARARAPCETRRAGTMPPAEARARRAPGPRGADRAGRLADGSLVGRAPAAGRAALATPSFWAPRGGRLPDRSPALVLTRGRRSGQTPKPASKRVPPCSRPGAGTLSRLGALRLASIPCGTASAYVPSPVPARPISTRRSNHLSAPLSRPLVSEAVKLREDESTRNPGADTRHAVCAAGSAAGTRRLNKRFSR
jgi:hypothetical protein